MKEVSIIIPAFKRVGQTLKTLDLLFLSNGLDEEFMVEIIVSDDSLDNKLKDAIQKKFGDKIVYSQPNKKGIASSKNNGAKIARFPILIFCDSDMEVEKDTVLNTITALEKHKTAGAIGGQVIWRTGPKDGEHDRPRKEDRMITVDKTTYTEAIYSRYIATYRDVFLEVGGYDEVVFNMRGEGSDLSVRYWRAGYPLVFDESLIVHHVHEVEGGIIRGVAHPEWGIAKDLLILSYKYDISDDKYKNFVGTVIANFEKFGPEGYYRIVEGIGKNLDFICKVKPIIDDNKAKMKAQYDFKFLEIFSDKNLFERCLKAADKKLQNSRKNIF
ncbi:MAG: glycosyltransferase [Candidatus Berkelbacteria bacterium]|nr:glycosyltransferase [Candidatus Berkelbacteria bacterium]